MSADEWDADDFEPSAPVVVSSDKWAGEDDDDVKDAWDADDDDEKKESENQDSGVIKAVQRKKKKPLAERIAEKEAEKAAREIAEREQLRVKSKDELKAEAERLKKIQEESDLRLAKEAFGVDSTGIDGMFPVTEEEFDKFREALKLKITGFNSSKFYGPFLEKLLQELVVDLTLEDLKKISTSTSSLYHEKQRQQKELEKQKKKKKVKSNVTLERDSDFNDIAAAGRGDFDDSYYDEDFI
ncbi:Eukaryotic translation initiation factor 3 subunit J [Mactra antiquata]